MNHPQPTTRGSSFVTDFTSFRGLKLSIADKLGCKIPLDGVDAEGEDFGEHLAIEAIIKCSFNGNFSMSQTILPY